MDHAILRDFGLTEREAKLFTALLQEGEASIGTLVRRTSIQHTKSYPALDKLMKKGLVSFTQKGRTRYFQAGNVDVLLADLDKKKEHLHAFVEQARQSYTNPETLQTYQGFNAVRACYEQLLKQLKQGDFYWVFAFRKEYAQDVKAKRLLRKVHQRLAEQGVEDKVIASRAFHEQITQNYEHLHTMQMRFTDHLFPEGLVIFKQGIMHLIWGEEPTAILIFSEKLSLQHQHFFQDMWNLIEKEHLKEGLYG